jgi:hypothetical protein
MRHGLAQRGIDAGLPALPCSLKGVQHIGIHSHIQGGTLHGGGGPASAALDVGLLSMLDDVGGVLARVKCELHEFIYCMGIK